MTAIVPDMWSVLMGPAAEILGWTLLHSLWQGALVAALLAVLLYALRGHGPRLRYAVGCVALLMLLSLPAGTAILLSEKRAAEPSSEEHPVVHQSSGEYSSRSGISSSSSGTWERLSAWANTEVRHVLPWIVLGWGLGVLGYAARLFGDIWRARRLRRSAYPAPDRWRERADDLAGRLGLDESILLRCSGQVSVPTVAGWWHPILFMPPGFLAGIPPSYVEAIILHELAHVRRHDVLIAWIQAFCEVVLFYHPATWWISGQVRQLREKCCDDQVLEAGASRVTYARALASLAEQACEKETAVTCAAAAGGGKLLGRVRRILGSPDPPSLPKRIGSMLTAALLFVGGSAGLIRSVGLPLTSSTDIPSTDQVTSVVLTRDSTGAVVIEPSFQKVSSEQQRPPDQQRPSKHTPVTPSPAENTTPTERRYAELDQRWGRISADSLLRSVRDNFDLSALNDRLGGSIPQDVLRASLQVHPDTLRQSKRRENGFPSLNMIRRAVQAPIISDNISPSESLPVHPDTLRRAVRREVNVSLSRTLRRRLNADTLEQSVEILVRLGGSDARSRRSDPERSPMSTRFPKERLLAQKSGRASQADSLMSQALEKTLQDTTIVFGERRTIIRDESRDRRLTGSPLESS